MACGCNGTSPPRLAGLGLTFDWTGGYGGGGYPYDPWGGGGGGLPGGSSFDQRWYDPILQTLGDIGSQLAGDIVDWLKARIGQEAWDRMPQETRDSFIRQAAREITGTTVNVGLPWLIGGGVVLLLLLRR